MGFVGVYRALYDYEPQTHQELAIEEGDLLYIVEKSSQDDWWKAKKKAADGEDHEPEGLIPNNYVEEAEPQGQAKALYDYDRQTDEELSFTEEAVLQVYDTSDPDWTLVGLNGEYGFAPANYIEIVGSTPPMPQRPRAVSPEVANDAYPTPSPPASPTQSPAAAIAGIIQQKTGGGGVTSPTRNIPARPTTPEASDEEPAPSLPQRPTSQQRSPPPTASPETRGVHESPTMNRSSYQDPSPDGPLASPSGFRLYNIHEMISHQGRNRKMPTTLGINLVKGIIMIAPERSRDGPSKEWTADKLDHYSIEGKHVFMELVRPSKSIDFHAGAKDTAKEIVSLLGEMAGAARAEGLREVLAAASSGPKKGHMLYEFMAQGDDEVTVAVGDEVIILDDKQSEEWWMVRRVKNNKEGVVPSSFIEVNEAAAETTTSNGAGGRSMVEQNRAEEQRLAKEAVRTSKREPASEVGPGLQLPDRHSSLAKRDGDGKKSKRDATKSKPNASQVRTWTDRTGSFKVDAQFIGLKDGKINLHKVNGVKIAVPVGKMALEDIEFVERETGMSLDDEKPLSDIKRRNTTKGKDKESATPAAPSGAAVEPPQPKYDWFDFFLQCGVHPQICERYAGAFERDQMGEENMQDIDATLLRTLGLKEGDILRVMKFLDGKFARVRQASTADKSDGVNGDSGGLFSGPDGALRNNTRKGRPAPAVTSTDTVDARAFEQKKDHLTDATPTPLRSVSAAEVRSSAGFDDDAWDVKPTKQDSGIVKDDTPVQAPARPALTGAISELSLLSPPLQPTITQQKTAMPDPPTQPDPNAGATRAFFDQLAQPGAPPQSGARQRPQPPPQTQTQNSMLPPPPQRPLSAPQTQQSTFGPPPLQPQTTGYRQQLAPPGQSMNDLAQQRYQQQYSQAQMQPQPTGFAYGQPPNGFMAQPTGYVQPQPTGYGQYPQFQPSIQQQFINGQQTGSPFADPPRAPYQPLQPQQTAFQGSYGQPQLQPQATGINSFLPPALQPQPTAFNTNGYGAQNAYSQPQMTQQQQAPPPPPPPSIPQQQAPAPLQPQKTGPAPPVRFGVTGGASKLVAQPTGKRANLSQATPSNPFGF